jgi:DNA integrity scanning protein DisA with diadenylate cyclase activity
VTPALVSICDAVFALATGRGALVVLVRQDPVDALVSGGVPLGGTVSKEILEAIFRKVSPVHDGATIIERDRISRVGAILPLTERMDLLSEFGTRHRAAFGLAERCDAGSSSSQRNAGL